MSSKTLCSWSREEIRGKKLGKVVRKPKYFCAKCARVANDKKILCKPEKLPG